MGRGTLLLLYLPYILIQMACQAPKETDFPRMGFNLAVFEKNNCYGERCANVSFSYPEFDSSHPYSQQINTHIEEQLKMYLQFGVFHDYETLDAAVDDFFEVFELEEDTVLWSVDVEARVSYMTERLISIEFKNLSHTGGNHPNEHLMFLNFDLDQQSLMVREDVVLDHGKLIEKADRAFKNYHQVSMTKSLQEDGRFFLEEGTIFLPFSIGYRGSNLVLYYNHYEISPYDMGPTELLFPLSELKNIVLIK
ncbi:hypothetical protein EL17_03765 [Anditalea andensis]|uniref:DUF3298 domain-containing protein n=2 Tax=Anditalea andensis TaxID=1048983 RepID=A0A074L2U0_9BACT|nr:hypothetical protein EL17_03765 [Anditalea andensis]